MDVVLASARSDLRFALEVLLREEPGITITGTATGSEGFLALIKSTHPDLVIFDWDLTGRQPAAVLAAARSLERPPYLIVLHQDSANRQAALDAGADAFVQHGAPPGELLDAVQAARPRRSMTVDLTPTERKGE